MLKAHNIRCHPYARGDASTHSLIFTSNTIEEPSKIFISIIIVARQKKTKHIFQQILLHKLTFPIAHACKSEKNWESCPIFFLSSFRQPVLTIRLSLSLIFKAVIQNTDDIDDDNDMYVGKQY